MILQLQHEDAWVTAITDTQTCNTNNIAEGDTNGKRTKNFNKVGFHADSIHIALLSQCDRESDSGDNPVLESECGAFCFPSNRLCIWINIRERLISGLHVLLSVNPARGLRTLGIEIPGASPNQEVIP